MKALLCLGSLAAVANACPPAWEGFRLNDEVLTVYSDIAAPGGPQLLVGGMFTAPGYLARFTGSGFSPVGSALDGEVRSITRHDDGSGSKIYITGAINVPLAPWTVCFGRLDGGSFAGFGPTTGPTAVCELATSYDLGHGPKFLTSGGFISPCSYVGQWNGQDWECLGGGLSSVAWSSAVYNDGSGPALFLAGFFLVNDLPFEQGIGVGKWDGSAWHSVGGGIGDRNGEGYAMACTVFDDGSGPELFVAGSFVNAGSTPVSNIAKWNGRRWARLGSGIDGTVRALCPFDDGTGMKLYVAGDFTHAGGVAAQHLARWDGATWSPCPAGGIISGRINTLAAHDPDGPGHQKPYLAMGGLFTSVGGVAATNFAILRTPVIAADFNGDGFVDGFDYDAFVACFEGNPCPSGKNADFIHDGFVDGFDYDAFVAAFEAGC